ncbi:MAG TPA: FHA domain-containing protein [Rhodocyclaceae bacterium]|jgi:predicted component of type VI protein secretion system|nr:FHA domain-containing protein [Rhodocyclaceae bacterium]
MPKLILSMDGLVLKEIPLDKERLTIGRKPNNDVQIDNLAISGQHAAITTILEDAFLEDLNSTNGTYVNGQPIKKHVLRPNDIIELGKYRLKFLADNVQPALAASDFVDTAALGVMVAPPEPDFTITEGAGKVNADARTQILSPEMKVSALEAAEAAATGQTGVVQVLSGPNAGRELVLNKSLTTLGKPGQQVAVITRRPHGYFITHVEGATFPQLNGQPLDAQARRLKDHDIIEIAGVKMEFFLRA